MCSSARQPAPKDTHRARGALRKPLHTNTIAYYTTPLIALTEQKFSEMQAAAIRWGFKAEDVGLVTGNRRVNPNARVLIVVAEILLNRLLHPEGFDFSQVSAVVMDEFHSFADPNAALSGTVAQHAAETHPAFAAFRDSRQLGRIHQLARPRSRSANRTRRRTRAQNSTHI